MSNSKYSPKKVFHSSIILSVDIAGGLFQMGTKSYLIFVISFTQARFWEKKFTPKNEEIATNGFRDKVA